MIHPDSRTLEWVVQCGKENGISDLTILEKTIRAFNLLEAISRSGCPFLFKGGSALMLQLDCNKRLSVDNDIVCDGWMDELREECPAEYDLPEEPVIWDEAKRSVWQAELDAIFAHLYGLSTDDLCYILDPEDVCGTG